MAVPKRRVSHCRQGRRRSHHAIKPRKNTYCNQCGEPVLPHYLCWKCGYSNSQGREMVAIKIEET